MNHGGSGVAARFPQNPIITPGLSDAIGDNINGPSLIRAPEWIPTPLGKYYLYFAHHRGTHIRLAYADRLEGPWRVFEPGTLKLSDAVCFDHIASPDVHVCHAEKRIRMYFHGPVAGYPHQVSMVALSRDGIRFQALPQVLGQSYFRVFRWSGWHFAVARGGRLFRSPDGLGAFVAGPSLAPSSPEGSQIRHTAACVEGSTLHLFYSRIGDCPESIVWSTVDLTADWTRWEAGSQSILLTPEMPYEGVDLPLNRSSPGAALTRVRELRDPAIYKEGSRTILLYSTAGESGIAMAELSWSPPSGL